MNKIFHQSILASKVLEFLAVRPDEKYIDATIGGGGHTREILARGGRVLGIDWDLDAVQFLEKKFKREIDQKRLILENENFTKIGQLAKKHNFEECAGIIFDLGISGHQLEMPERGFSFTKAGPLDMRMNKNLTITASDLLKVLTQKELAKLFKQFSEKKAVQIAKEIIRVRKIQPIETTLELANIASKISGFGRRLHPATKVFLALRAAVNFELTNLENVLPLAFSLLKPGGRLAIISFHSQEDAIVKDFFKRTPGLAVLTVKPLRPDFFEILQNPQSRSARLRVGEKIG